MKEGLGMLNGNTQELSDFSFDFENEDPMSPMFVHNDSFLIFKFEGESQKIIGGPVGGEIEGCRGCSSEEGFGSLGTWQITDHFEKKMFWAELDNQITGPVKTF